VLCSNVLSQNCPHHCCGLNPTTTCPLPMGGSLHCISHSGNRYPLTGAAILGKGWGSWSNFYSIFLLAFPVAGVIRKTCRTWGSIANLYLLYLHILWGLSQVTYFHIHLAFARCPRSICPVVNNTTWIHLLWLQKSVTTKWYSLCPMALCVLLSACNALVMYS
jgi:hypothetical protein